MTILLIGFMGSGKTSIGKELAKSLGYEFIELDEAILKHSGYSNVDEVFKHKLSIWKECELEVCKELSHEDNLIIACGGGLLDNDLNLNYFKENCKNFRVIYLKAKPETLYQRIVESNHKKGKDFSKTLERIYDLLPKRELLYSENANIILETDNKKANEVVYEIVDNVFQNMEFSELPLYQKLLLLSINKDEKTFYHEALKKTDTVVMEAILLDLLTQNKIKIVPNGIEILDQWYVPADDIVRTVFHNITTPPNENRLGTEIQKLSHLNDQNIFEKAVEHMLHKNLLRMEQKQYFLFKTIDSYYPTFPTMIESIVEDLVTAFTKKNTKFDLKNALLFLLLERFGIEKKVLSKKVAAKIHKQVYSHFAQEKISPQVELLNKESQWATAYFSYNP